jgi:adenosylmethionine---8-amino-7-oxononanoate aminotransferase
MGLCRFLVSGEEFLVSDVCKRPAMADLFTRKWATRALARCPQKILNPNDANSLNTKALLIESDHSHLWHPFTQMQQWTDGAQESLVIARGEGVRLWDTEGRCYLDGNSSIWTNLHGHGHPRIVAAIQDQAARLAHSSFLGLTHEPAIRLGAALTGLFPPETLTRVFYTDNGSTAVECAMKMAVQFWQLTGHPERCHFAAFDQAYHGDTLGAGSLGGIPALHGRFSHVGLPVRHVGDLVALEMMSEADSSRLAAVVIEPLIQGAAGMRCWPHGMLRALRAWCDVRGVLLILDEVMTGFGRTGTLFACEQENVIPDFLCLAKGLTGGTTPLAATLTTERVYRAFLGRFDELKTFFYGHSYCAHPIGCAAALATLEIFAQEQTLAALQPKIALLTKGLATLQAEHPRWIGEVRQCGFIAGIDLMQDAPTSTPWPWQSAMGARVCHAARAYGLLTRPVMDTVVLMPPLCTTADELHAMLRALSQALTEVSV